MSQNKLTINIQEGFQIDSFDVKTGEVTFKPAPIKERIKNFDDVLKYHNITDAHFHGTPDEVAYQKLQLIALALNEGWMPNWDDSGERKYYPWFKMASGVFSYADFGHHWEISAVGSRLCFKSDDLAIYAANTFTDIYRDFFTL